MTPPRLPRLPKHAVAIAAAIAFLGFGFVLYGSTGHDDSHITYWVAYALQKFGALVNYNGERIEQSSSFAHVILLALLGLVTRVQMPTLGPITSIVAGVAAVLLTARLARIASPKAPRAAEWLVATASCFVYWGFGGLEATLVAAAALWLVLECAAYLEAPSRRGLWRAGLSILLYVAMRPESALVIGCVFAAAIAYALLRRRRHAPEAGEAPSIRPALELAAIAVVSAGLLFGFRRAYFGVFFPNPVYSKAPGLAIGDGLGYLFEHTYADSPWVVPAVLLGLYHVVKRALTDRSPQFAAVLTGAFTTAYLAFIVLVGGDWMTGGRFLSHVFPLIAVVTMIGLGAAFQSVKRFRIAYAALIVLNLYGVIRLSFIESTGSPIWATPGVRAQIEARIGDRGYSWFETTNLVHRRDTTVAATLVDVIGKIREKEPNRKLVIMSTQAGMVMYHAFKAHYGALRFVDTCSLATRDFLKCNLPTHYFNRSRLGMIMSYETYFTRQATIDAACGSSPPDIVFGLNTHKVAAALKAAGYTIVYDQRGAIKGDAKRRGLSTFISDEFIAVDTTLARSAGIETRERWSWDIH